MYKIDKTFIKIYLRKGRTQRFLKDYSKAMATFVAGLKIQPENKDLLAEKAKTEQMMQGQNSGGHSPEIQKILNDPDIKEVLRNAGGGAGTDPAAAQRAMSNPIISAKIQKLVDAGVVSLGK